MSDQHDLTLMQQTYAEYVGLEEGQRPLTRQLRCQECGYTIDVDWHLFNKGEYYCDGSDHVAFRQFYADRPSMMDVAHPEVGLAAQQELAMILRGMQQAQAELSTCLSALELWFYRNVNNKGGTDDDR